MKMSYRVEIVSFFCLIFGFKAFPQYQPVISYGPDTITSIINTCGDSLQVPVLISNSGNDVLFYGVSKLTRLYDDFESGTGNWICDGFWGASTTAYEGMRSLSESPDGNYCKTCTNYAYLKDTLVIHNTEAAEVSFWAKYNYQYGNASLCPQISVNGGDWIYLGVLSSNFSSAWIEKKYSLTDYVSVGDHIRFRFIFWSNNSSGYDGGAIDNFLIEGAGISTDWLEFPVHTGILQPGQSGVFTAFIRTQDLYPGTYIKEIFLGTNDPVHPCIQLTYQLIYNGNPFPNLNPDIIEFDTVIQNTLYTRDVCLKNTGCNDLIIDSISSSLAVNISGIDAVIGPGDSSLFQLRFLALTTGNYWDTLLFYTNAGVLSITVQAFVNSQPELTLIPQPMIASVLCGEVQEQEVSITNTGASPLECRVFRCFTEDFENGLDQWESNGKWGLWKLERYGEYWAYQGEYSLTYCPLNLDQYYGGNWNYWIELKRPLIVSDAENLSLSLYLYPRLYCESDTLFIQISINNGEWVNIQYYIDNPQEWIPFIYSLKGLAQVGDLLNIRFLFKSVYYQDGLCRSYGTDIDSLTVTGAAYPWLSGFPASFHLLPGESVNATILYNGVGLNAGTHEQQFWFETNIPTTPHLSFNATLQVSGEPGLSLLSPAIVFDTTLQHDSIVLELPVMNSGCDSLWVTGLDCPNPAFFEAPGYPFLILPGDTVLIPVTFRPPSPGNYTSQLMIITEDTTASIPVQGFAMLAPVLAMEPDSLYAEVTLCDDTVSTNLTLTNTGTLALDWHARPRDSRGWALGCYQYDQRVEIGDMGDFPTRGTFECWVSSQDFEGDQVLLSTNGADDYSYAGIHIVRENGNWINVYISTDYENPVWDYGIGQMPTPGEWHHVAITWDVDLNAIWTYFDGFPAEDSVVCLPWPTEISNLVLGAGISPDYPWVGEIDEIRLWNTRRTHEEILASMNHSLLGNEEGLWAYWPANEGDGEQIFDLSGNGHHSIYCGAIWQPSGAKMPNLMDINPVSGTLAPGDQVNLTACFYGNNLNAGKYETGLILLSNDPLNNNRQITAEIEVTGYPIILLDSSSKDFGEVFTGQSKESAYQVYNLGCDTAVIYSIMNSNYPDVFSLFPLPLVILPNDSAFLHVFFQPDDTVSYQETFELQTNAGTMVACATGQGKAAPVMGIYPDTVIVTLLKPESATIDITIENIGGGSMLTGSVHQTEHPDVNETTPATNYCPSTSNCGSLCSEYGIYRVIVANIDNATGPATQGYQDYTSAQTALIFPGCTYELKVLTTFSSRFHNVHAWIDYNNDALFDTAEQVMNSHNQFIHTALINPPADAVKSIPLRMRITGEYSYYNHDSPCISALMGQTEDYSVLINSGLTIQSPDFEVIAGDSSQVGLLFDSEALLVGDQERMVYIYSNDPAKPLINLPCHLTVEGPALTFGGTSVDFGEVMAHDTVRETVMITNQGVDTVHFSSAWTTDSQFGWDTLPSALPPRESSQVELSFSPIAPGTKSGFIYWSSSAGIDSLALTGTGIEAPVLIIGSDSLVFTTICQDTMSNTFTIGNNAGADLSFAVNTGETLDDGLLCHYTLNSNTQDISGNGRHLTNYGAVTAKGKYEVEDQAYYFSNTYMKYNNTNDLPNLYQPCASLSLWFKTPGPSVWQTPTQGLCNIGSGRYSGYTGLATEGIRVITTHDSMGVIVAIDHYDYFIGQPLHSDAWIHLCFTYDGNDLCLYIDGIQTNIKNIDGKLTYSSSNLPSFGNQLGYNSYKDWIFKGYLDNIRFYNRALGQDEIMQVFNSENALPGLQINPASGVIPADSSLEVNVLFNSAKYSQGLYNAPLMVTTNDPLQQLTLVPVNATVTNSPELSTAPLFLYFDTVPEYGSDHMSLTLTNPDCADLEIAEMYTLSDAFEADYNELIIPSDSSVTITVTFRGLSLGNHLDTLFILSEAGIIKVPLEGYCRMPFLSAEPGSLQITAYCYDNFYDTLCLENNGDITLSCSFWRAMNHDWLSLPTGTIWLYPGEDTCILVGINRAGLEAGLYHAEYSIQSNDPVRPVCVVPVNLLVVNDQYPVNLGPDRHFCLGEQLVIDAGDYSSYLWSNDSVTRVITVDTSGQVWVDVTDDDGCFSSDTIQLFVNEFPTAEVSFDTVVCWGSDLHLNGTAGNLPSPEPTIIKVGNGLVYSTVTPQPFATYYRDSRVVCLYKHPELTALGLTAGYITRIGIIVEIPSTTTMNGFHIRMGHTLLNTLTGFVTGLSDVYNGTHTAYEGINFFQLQQAFYWDGISNILIEFCFDNSTGNTFNMMIQWSDIPGCTWGRACNNCAPGCSLTGGSANARRPNLMIEGSCEYSNSWWEGPNGFTSMSDNPVIISATSVNNGNYWYFINNGYGCVDSASKAVLVSGPPVELGNDTGYCTDGGIPLDAGIFDSYQWSNDSTTQHILVDTTGTYWVDVVDSNGCEFSDTVMISVYNKPHAYAGNDTIVCSGTSPMLTPTITNLVGVTSLSVQIGDGENFSDWSPSPFGTNYSDGRVIMLYKSAELQASGLLAGYFSSIGIRVGSPGSPPVQDFQIRMGTTQMNSLGGFVQELTVVYYCNTYEVVSGVNWFELQQPWFWDGYSNLLVEFCFNNNTWGLNSSFQYSYLPGSVWGRFCNNCAPGCDLQGGNSAPWRANLFIEGQVNLTQYNWSGPGGFSSTLRNPVIPFIGTSQQGYYTLIVDNGFNCTDTAGLEITVAGSPIAKVMQTDTTILGGDTLQISAEVSGGVPPYTYAWSPPDGLSLDTVLDPLCYPAVTTRYILTVTGSNQCNDTATVSITVIPRYFAGGQLYYPNISLSGLYPSTILLKDSLGVPMDTVPTDVGGNYVFFIPDGTYSLECSTSLQPGGINATDALAIATHLVYLNPLTGILSDAADVNGNGYLSSADALLILHRTVGNILTFPAGDWFFESKQFAVSGGDVVNNLKGICYGDVNASFIPSVKMGSQVELMLSGECHPDEEGRVLISLITLEPIDIAAASLLIGNFPDIMTITDVSAVKGEIAYKIKGNDVDIAWYDLNTRRFETGDTLFVIEALLTKESQLPQPLHLMLGSSTEFASIFGEIIPNLVLGLPAQIIIAGNPPGFSLGPCRPNPADQLTFIPCNAPGEGFVILRLFNSLGQLAFSEIVPVSTGLCQIGLGCTNLSSGLYTACVIFSGKDGNKCTSQKIIVNH